MENLNSSIGAAWPPERSSHERIRGFYTDRVIASQADSDQLAAYVYSAIEEMNTNETISRVSLRVIVELGSLARLNFEGMLTTEALLPIAGTDLGIAYIGANAPHRSLDTKYADMHRDLLNEAVERTPTTREPANVQIVNTADPSGILEDFGPLYEIFGYDLAATEGLLRNNANTIAYAMLDDQIVSTAMAERGTVTINGYGSVALCEITEASTHPGYRGRGLYGQVSRYLLEHLTNMRQEDPESTDVIYGESNLAMPGVIYAAHQNGRRFSYFDRGRLGLENNNFGILPQNFKVSDGEETRAYNDFAVSYLPL